MNTNESIETLARSYAARGVRTSADVARFCRPSRWLRLGLAAVLGGVGGLLAYSLPGVTAWESVAAAGVYTVAALLAGSAFVWLMDNI